MISTTAGRRHPGVDVVVVGALVLVLLVAPALLAAHAGALWIPHNDSWAHSRIAADLAETGSLHLIGFNRASMVGMMAVLGPLGSSIVAQHVFVMVCGTAVLGFSYATARRVLPRPSASLATALVGLAPGFILLSTSYMTDVPMMAGIVATLYFGIRFVESGRAWHWLAALLLGAWSVTVREPGLAALAAVSLVAWLMRRDRRFIVVIGSAVALTSLVIFELWRRSLTGDDPPHVGLNVTYAVRSTVMAVMSLLFVCAPALALAAKRPHGPLGWASSGAAAMAGLGLLAVLGPGMLLGNYLAPEGAYIGMLHGTRSTVPSPLVWAAALVSIVGLVCLATRLSWPPGARVPRPSRWTVVPAVLTAFLGLYGAGTFLQTLSGQAMFERYFFPLIAPVAILALMGIRLNAPRSFLAAAAGAILLLVTSLITAHTWASTGAVWRTAEELVSRGVDAQDVDAGFAWVGYHSDSSVGESEARPEVVGSWAGQFADSRQCVIVSHGTPAVENGHVEVLEYPKYIIGGTDQVVIQALPECR